MNETSGSAPLMVNHQPSRTFAEASPVVAGYFTVAFVFGLMAVNAGLPMWLPVAMCLSLPMWPPCSSHGGFGKLSPILPILRLDV